jgi:gamma-glutamyl hercynylcysteine S-oxide synthase
VLEERYAALLDEARRRTVALVEPVTDRDMDRVHNPLMSPLVWDLGHIAAFEDLWLCQRVGGLEPLRPELGELYDASETPRRVRGELPYLRREEAFDYMAQVRERALGVLGRGIGDDGFVWEMIVQHEHQHNETMLQTLQLAEPGTYAPPRPRAPAAAPESGTVRIDAGPFSLGDDGEGFAYDNERPLHEVDLPAFAIDRGPVTNGAYLEFVEDGGYERQELWSRAGWAQRTADDWQRPLYWAEWEKAAQAAGDERGNLDQLEFGPGPAGPFVGDCWEWTASVFGGYPGFRAFPYREYSEVFFGPSYKVLRGASWATRPRVARVTFRNWDYPERRQLFVGFRCAEDA